MTVKEAIEHLELEFPYLKADANEDLYHRGCISVEIEVLAHALSKEFNSYFSEDEVFEELNKAAVLIDICSNRSSVSLSVDLRVDTPQKARLITDALNFRSTKKQEQQLSKMNNQFADFCGYMAAYFKSIAG